VTISNAAAAVATASSFAFDDAEYMIYLACVGTFICASFEKLNSTLNRLHDGF
jgi:hypothetical protein